ncbi:MAG: 3-methyl-2-oxobutanoate hydroxymethyltransferase, partial [Chitinophagales bacterium]
YGVMGIVLEMIPSEISKKITETIKIPTIGIGAGADCTGQVLVSDDMLGRYNLINPKFLKRYANQYEDSVRAFKEYIEDVRLGGFPSDNNSY